MMNVVKILIVFLLCFFQAKAQNRSGYGDKNFFPIMAWDDVREEGIIKKMAGCGINIIAFVPPRLLDACQKYKVKAIVFDQRATSNWDVAFNAEKANVILKELIKKYNKHPAVYGYHLKDEPDGNQLFELGKSTKLIHELAPGKWPYINLPPGMGDWYDKEYLQLFVDQCKSGIISFDNYPIGEKVEFSYGFWANMWDIRSASLRNHVDFHVIVLSAAHFSYRVPTYYDLSLQVFGSLVYGARGLGYYKVVSETLKVLGAPELGNFRGSPIDEFGDMTPGYYNLQNLNKRVQALAPTLLKLRSDDVYHIGEIPERNHGVKETSLIKAMDTGTQFIVGEFTHQDDGSRWVMVVNKNLQESTFLRPKFDKQVKSVQLVSQVTGKLIPFPNVWFSLAPGQGVLLKLEN